MVEMNIPERELTLTVPESAEWAGVCPKTIRNRVNDGTLEARMPGNKILVIFRSLQEWYESTGPRAVSAAKGMTR